MTVDKTKEIGSKIIMADTAPITKAKEIPPEERLTVETVLMKESTKLILSELKPKQIIIFGNGWLTRCPKCGILIEINEDHKTFVSKNRKNFRIAPSVLCPGKDCKWSAAIVIKTEYDLIELFKALDEDTEEGDDDDGKEEVFSE